MIKHSFLQEWPLAAFTLAIQVACGLAIATTICALQPSVARLAVTRNFGIAIFPIAAAGLLLSLLHLGRPFSAWRALSNRHSKLSLEILLTAAFGIAALACSVAWWSGDAAFRLYFGAAASLSGLAAIIASAAIYQIPARPFWNSPWVMTSFLGATLTTSGLVLTVCLPRLGITVLAFGNAILVLSGAWMWLRNSQTLPPVKPLLRCFVGCGLLTGVALLSCLAANVSSRNVPSSDLLAFTSCVTILGMVSGRLLMFALAEFEPRF